MKLTSSDSLAAALKHSSSSPMNSPRRANPPLLPAGPITVKIYTCERGGGGQVEKVNGNMSETLEDKGSTAKGTLKVYHRKQLPGASFNRRFVSTMFFSPREALAKIRPPRG